MKINQKFARKAILAASLTVSVFGFNSMFNEAQAKMQLLQKSVDSPCYTIAADGTKTLKSMSNDCHNGESSCVNGSCD